MFIRKYLAAPLVGALLFGGCSGDDNTAPVAPSSSGLIALQDESNPCEGVEEIGWAVKVTGVSRGNTRCDTTWTDPDNSLGEPDSVFVSIGGDSSNSITLFMDEEIFDGPGCDMVVYETVTNEDDANYDVYLSNSSDSGFKLVASVSVEGPYCIDLAETSIDRGQYVMIVQSQDVKGFGPEVECDSTWGADIDAVGVLNIDVCGEIDDLCEHIGTQVDMFVPPDADYSNHGQYVSRVAHAATEFLRHYEDCYSDDERDGVHGCVVSERARTDVGKKQR